MQIYIHRDNEDFGPYSREAVLEYVKQGVFQAGDRACYAGMADWKTVSELLGIAGASGSGRVTKFMDAGSRNPTERIQSAAPKRQPAPRVQRRASRPPAQGKKGFLIAFNIVLVLIIATAGYIRLTGGGDKVRKYGAVLSAVLANAATRLAELSAPPAPVTAPEVTKKQPIASLVPVAPASSSVAPSTPADSAASAASPATQAPAMAATPAAAPGSTKPFDPADLAGIPEAWPKTVKLKQAFIFPAVFDGKIVGKVAVPAGAVVKLVNIEGEVVTVEYRGGPLKMSWKWTDLDEEVAKSTLVAPTSALVAAPVAAVPASAAPMSAAPVPAAPVSAVPASTPATEVTATMSTPAPDGD